MNGSQLGLELLTEFIYFYLSSRDNDQELELTSIVEGVFFTETFDDGEGKGHSLSGACSVPGNKVIALVDLVESLVLNWEEPLDAFIFEDLDHLLIFDEVAELTLFWELSLLDFDGLGVDIPE